MSIELLINARSYETRVALVENNILTEFHLERPQRNSLAGNIYKGRVVRVLPGCRRLLWISDWRGPPFYM